MADLSSNQSAMSVYIMGADLQGLETYPIRSTINQDLSVTDSLVQGGVQGAITVGTTAVAARVSASNYAGRKMLTVMSTDGSIFFGYTNSVTTSTGTEIFRNQMATFKVEDSITIWLIATANRNVRITEGK